RDLLRGDAAAGRAYVCERRVELRRGDAQLDRDDFVSLLALPARLLSRIGGDDVAAAPLGDAGDALQSLGGLFDFERERRVADDLALDGCGVRGLRRGR